MWSFGKKRLEKYMKCREFFIPHFVDFLLCCMVFGYRMLLERGNTITIGFKWWFGGAQTFASELGYGRADVFYSGGDIKGQDYTTPQYMLNMFVASTLVYLDPSSPDYELFKYVLRHCGDYLVAKLVNFTGNMWRWVVGTMPSGHYTTSHCNSWILAVYFWAYVYGVHVRNRKAGILYKTQSGFGIGAQYFIRFKVYGDNHVLALNREAMKYLSYMDFVSFVKGLGIDIHDIQNNVPLISVPDTQGGLKTTGIVFLKRYLIEVTTKSGTVILPYKTFKDTAPKIVFGNSPRRNVFDYLLALSGLAWDTMGVNTYVYNIIVSLYQAAAYYIQKNNLGLLSEYLNSYADKGEEARKRARKIGIPLEDYMTFPTREELLRRHKFVPESHWYRRAPKLHGCIWDDLFQGKSYPNQYFVN
jgi:hypothetical protein